MTTQRSTTSFLVQSLFWVLALAAVFVYQAADPPGWDLKVYRKTMQQAIEGKDPYVLQTKAVSTGSLAVETVSPTQYLYPPITLPVLAAAGRSRIPFKRFLYWAVYAGAIFTMVALGVYLAEPRERLVLRFLAPAVPFFPGLLQHDNFLSGNICFICYGAVLGAVAYGWKRKNYLPFYLAVLVFACCKAPWLTLLLLPVLLDRKQWLPASTTAVVGVAILGAQRWLCPILFQHFLDQIGMEFGLHGFGVSPAGLLAGALFRRGYPFLLPGTLLYAGYGLAVLAILIFLARRFERGEISLRQSVPLLLIGVFLLNPRIKDYDVPPLTIPLGLSLWRFCEARTSRRNAIAICCGVFVFGNVFALTGSGGPNTWNWLEGVLLAGIFACGSWQLCIADKPDEAYAAVSLQNRTVSQ